MKSQKICLVVFVFLISMTFVQAIVDTPFLFVTYNNGFSKINLTNNSVMSDQGLAGNNKGVSVDIANDSVYVTSCDYATLYKLNYTTSALITQADTGTGNCPVGVAVDKVGDIWVTDSVGIKKYNPSLSMLLNDTTVGGCRGGAVVDSNNSVIFSTQSILGITKMQSDGNLSWTKALGGASADYNFNGITVDFDDNVYVVYGSLFSKVYANGSLAWTKDLCADYHTLCGYGYGVSTDNYGDIYVVNLNSANYGGAYKFNSDGDLLVNNTQSNRLYTAFGVSLSSQDKVYVFETDWQQIRKLDNNLNPLLNISVSLPTSLGDATGNLLSNVARGVKLYKNTINISSQFPATNSKFHNTEMTFSVLVNATYNTTNATLYIDGLNNQSVPYNWSGVQLNMSFFVNVSDGSHTFYIKVSDNTTSRDTSTSTFLLETIKPYFSANSTFGYVQKNTNLTVNMTITDTNLDTVIFMSNYNGSFINVTFGNYTYFNISGIGRKNNTLQMFWFANDTYGNTNVTYMNLTMNNTIPEVINISLSPLPNDGSQDLYCNYSYFDLDDDVQESNYTIWFNSSYNEIAYANTTVLRAGNLTGNSTWICMAKYSDGFGNSSWYNSTALFMNDTTAPSLTGAKLNAMSGYSDTAITIYANCSDTQSAVSYVRVNITDPNSITTANIPMTLSSGSQYTKTYTPSIASSTPYHFTFTCSDASGNVVSNVSTGVNFTSSTRPAVVTPSGGGGGSSPVILVTGNQTVISISPKAVSSFYFNSPSDSNVPKYVTLKSNVALDRCTVATNTNSDGNLVCKVNGSDLFIGASNISDNSLFGKITGMVTAFSGEQGKEVAVDFSVVDFSSYFTTPSLDIDANVPYLLKTVDGNIVGVRIVAVAVIALSVIFIFIASRQKKGKRITDFY